VKLIAYDGRTESRRNEAMHFALARMSFEGSLREEQLAIERHLETAAAAGQQHRPRDPRRPRVEKLSHQTGGSIRVVSDDAELDLELVRSVGRLDVHALTLRREADGDTGCYGIAASPGRWSWVTAMRWSAVLNCHQTMREWRRTPAAHRAFRLGSFQGRSPQ
jgi:hypothetical protein